MLLSPKVGWPESQLTRANTRKAVPSANVTIKYFPPQMLHEIHGNFSQLDHPKALYFCLVWFSEALSEQRL